MGFDASAGGGATSDTRTKGLLWQEGNVVRMKRVDGKRRAFDPLQSIKGAASNEKSTKSTDHAVGTRAPDRALLQEERPAAEQGVGGIAEKAVTRFAEVLQVQFQVRQPDDPSAKDTMHRMDQPAVSTADTSSGSDKSGSGAAHKILHGHNLGADGQHRRRGGVEAGDSRAFGSVLLGQVGEVERLLERLEIDEGVVTRLSNGELKSREMWEAGPALVLNGLCRLLLQLAAVIRQAAAVSLLVLGVAWRSAAWMLGWMISVGDAKEWWVPDIVDFLQGRMQSAQTGRSLAYLRLYRARAHALVSLLYAAVVGMLSPEFMAQVRVVMGMGMGLWSHGLAWSTIPTSVSTEPRVADATRGGSSVVKGLKSCVEETPVAKTGVKTGW